MTTPAQDRYHLHRAFITDQVPAWARRLQDGVPEIGWDGDRALVLAHNVLKDEVEVWYSLPGRKPVLVLQVPFAEWDINKACARLRDADGRKHSIEDRIVAVDRHNEAVEKERARQLRDRKEHVTDRMRDAIRRDTGNHVRPILVPRGV